MEYIGFITCVIAFTTAGYFFGKYHRRLPSNKVLIDLDTFEYLKERDEELWEIEKAERNNITTFSAEYKNLSTAQTGMPTL